ncbi:MAG: methyltransferase domain-containing protein [Acidobacteriaceae bacterium]
MSRDSERIIGLYDENAAEWDRLRGPGSLFEKPWLDRFLGLLGPGATILDLGCGSGRPIAAYFIGCGYAVTGVDSSPALIDLCRSRFPQSEWMVADMRTLELGRRFDGAIAWDSFFHLNPDDQRAAFRVFARHVQSRGALMFTSGGKHGEVLSEFAGEPLYHASLEPGGVSQAAARKRVSGGGACGRRPDVRPPQYLAGSEQRRFADGVVGDGVSRTLVIFRPALWRYMMGNRMDGFRHPAHPRISHLHFQRLERE